MNPASMERLIQQGTLKESDVLSEEVLLIEFKEFWTSHILCRNAHKALHTESGELRNSKHDASHLSEAAAARGYAERLYNVAIMHNNGSAGLPRDFEMALEYLHKAAKKKP